MAERPQHNDPQDKKGFVKGKTEQKKAKPAPGSKGRERQYSTERKKKVR